MALELRVLGPLTILDGGTPVELPASKKTRALLGYLVATGRSHSRDRLTALLFDSTDDPRGNLRWSLSKLRGAIGGAIVAERDVVGFSAQGLSVDLLELRAAVQGGARADRLRAVERCRGALLEGLELPDDHSFDQWLTEARHEVLGLQRKLYRGLAEAGGEDALPAARAWAALDATDETAQATLVALLLKLGRGDEAESVAASAERRLRAAHPGRFLAELEAARRAKPTRELPAISARAPTPPPASKPILGRGRELAALEAALDDPRLLVITGPQGVGRSRVLEHAASRVVARGGLALLAQAHKPERGRRFGVIKDAFAGLSVAERPALDDHEAFRAGLIELAEARPIGLFIDDLQWIDEASAALLHHLLRSERPRTLVVMATIPAPAEDGPGEALLRALGRKVSRLELPALDRASSLAVVASLDPSLDGAALFEKSHGLPRLLVSMAEAKRRGEATISPTVEALVTAPLEGLDPTALEVAEWAAFLEAPVKVEDLAELSCLASAPLARALAALEAQGVFVSGSEGYAFAHEMIRYAAYRQLSAQRRKLVEAAVAELKRSR